MAFHGKVALVTGGASGMGKVAALRMAHAGARVAIVDISQENLDATSAESDNISAYRCDVSDIEQVRDVVKRVETELGAIDRLWHGAAIMPGDSILNMPAELNNRMMAINYGGTVNFVTEVMPLMEKRGKGDLVVFGSMAGSVLTHNLGGYSASKAATNTLMECLVRENKNSPLRILLVCPPAVDTPLVAQAIEKGPGSLQLAQDTNRLVTPEFIIDAVEEALEKGKWIVQPGEARLLMWVRRFFPGLLWWVMEKANKVQ